MAPGLLKAATKPPSSKAIREALRTAKRVWLATDLRSRGAAHRTGNSRALQLPRPGHAGCYFTAQDSQTIRDAFGPGEAKRRIRSTLRRRRCAPTSRPDLQPVADANSDRHSWSRCAGALSESAESRRQLWRSCASASSKSEISCRRRIFEVVAAATVAGGQFQMRHAPQERIVRREVAQAGRRSGPGLRGARLACASKTSDKGRQSSTICPRSRNCAARASVGRPARR
jgi:DNA topoisomerase-3